MFETMADEIRTLKLKVAQLMVRMDKVDPPPPIKLTPQETRKAALQAEIDRLMREMSTIPPDAPAAPTPIQVVPPVVASAPKTPPAQAATK